ncbi:MAG: endolytic transglycosylase MltG [Candidatus Stahlbacteria bacterium]|nr:MAG: endolytic transglycosylase MltG [Candidatus Stahlbacteria bacterium]
MLKIIKIICIFLISAVLLFPIALWQINLGEIAIKIEKGKNLKEIAELLAQNKIIEDSYGFRILCIQSGKADKLSYGWYKLQFYQNPRKVLSILSKGERMTVCITIPPGLTVVQTLNLLANKTDIDIKSMDSLIHTEDFIHRLGINVNSIEGFLFPDTYILYRSEEPEKVIKKMVFTLFSIIRPDSRLTIDLKEFSAYEILTIASMIEREAMVDREKPIIASVIYNRLKKGMRLQIDATVLYALGYHKARIFYKDLRVDSPYNTYKYRGIPPGPIANPGYQSILAAMHPAKTDYLYYVATGKGDHIFTKTLSAHNKAKFEVKRNW